MIFWDPFIAEGSIVIVVLFALVALAKTNNERR